MLTIPERVALLLVIGVSVWIFLSAVILRMRLVKRGKPDGRFDNLFFRFIRAIWLAFSQRVLVRHRPFPGLMHAFVFWGFVVFLISTFNMIVGAFHEGFSLLGSGWVSEVHRFLLDLMAILVSFGVVALGIRRFIFKPDALTYPRKENEVLILKGRARHAQVESFVVLLLIFILMISFILEEGASVALEAGHPRGAFLGAWFGTIFLGSSELTLKVLERIGWWVHLVGVFTFLAIIPQSKHFHIFTGIVNVFLKRFKPYGYLETIDLENTEVWGATTVEELNQKNLFDTFACIECGRCQDNCPAYLSGLSLSPKWLIVNTRELLLEERKSLLKGEKAQTPLVGNVFTEEALWACTTCGACMEVCPMDIEHIPSILEMRRAQVLMEGKFPKELNPAFRGLESQANPWGIFSGDRMKWAEDLKVVTVEDNPSPDILYWVGCASSFDDRAKKIARSMIKIFEKAGISYAVLGNEEKCSGDPARRTGNEYLFQMLAEENIKTLKKYKFKKIVTHCPHCYSTIKFEYPQFGGEFEVVHHSEFIEDLIKKGKILLKAPVGKKVTFHDPCYLGRHNGIYEQPRNVIKYSTGNSPIEMDRTRERSLCCGAGGGRMWMETRRGQRVNEIRAEEALKTGAEVIGTACPFCMRMLVDGLGAKDPDGKMEVKDIAELVAEAI